MLLPRPADTPSPPQRVRCGGVLALLWGVLGVVAWRWWRAREALAEERHCFQSVIDFLPWQVFTKDREGRFRLDNRAHREFLSRSQDEEVLGRQAREFFPRGIAELYEADDRRIWQTGQPMLEHEEPSQSRNGRLIWRVMSKAPLYDRRGRMVGLIGHCHDISGQKLAAERARLLAEQLERCHGELRDFTAIAAHDLQEPLRKIQTFADRLRIRHGQALGGAGRGELARLTAAAGRAQTLVLDLLTLSQLSGGPPRLARVELGEIVSEVLGELKPSIKACRARVEVGKLPAIEADPVQMRQLFRNLLGNALKFHKPGVRPQVAISARCMKVHDYALAGAEPGDEVCHVRVSDNGIGFESTYAEQIFTLFQRLHSREYEGTGIGLPVCRKIALLHGGNITAKGAEGVGATFLVLLPVKPRVPTPQPTEP